MDVALTARVQCLTVQRVLCCVGDQLVDMYGREVAVAPVEGDTAHGIVPFVVSLRATSPLPSSASSAAAASSNVLVAGGLGRFESGGDWMSVTAAGGKYQLR